MGPKWALRRLRIFYVNGWFWFYRKLLTLAASKFNTAWPPTVFKFSPGMMSPATSVGCKLHKRVHFWSSFGLDFSIMVQPILKKFAVLETVIQELHFFFCNLLYIFGPWPECSLTRKWGSSGPTVVYALRSWLIAVFSLYISMHYINGWCRIVVAVNSTVRVDAR